MKRAMKTITCRYAPGEMACLKHDLDKVPRMVTQVFLGVNGGVRYELSLGDRSSPHYEEELCDAPGERSAAGFRVKMGVRS